MALTIGGSVRRDRFTDDSVQLVDPATPSGVQPTGKASGWTLAISEEFGGTVQTVDAELGHIKFRNRGPTWGTWYPGTASMPNPHTNNPGTELEWYDPSRVSTSGGELVLTAVEDNVHTADGLPYTSGLIQHNPSYNTQYGYAEARIKCPGAAFTGSWPAFWLIPASYDWPPEIDIMENFGSDLHFTISNWSDDNIRGEVHATTATQFQTYGCEWGAGLLRWYLNGTEIASEPGAVPNVPMYCVLNLAVRNQTDPTFAMQVEHFRFWKAA